MNADGLPVAMGPADLMRTGFRNLESEMMAPHPIEGVERRAAGAEFSSKIERVRRTYGSHMAMRIATEQAQFNREHRLPGLPSSKIGLEILSGKDNTIEFADFLNNPQERADPPKVDFHRVTEIKHGLI